MNIIPYLNDIVKCCGGYDAETVLAVVGSGLPASDQTHKAKSCYEESEQLSARTIIISTINKQKNARQYRQRGIQSSPSHAI